MELYVQLYIRKIVNTIINNLEQNRSTMLFVKHYNNLNVPFEEIENSVSESQADIVLLYHEFSTGSIQEAYAPFLSWIREIYQKYYADIVSVDDFIIQSNVYFSYRSVFKSYIETGICSRDEDMILVEREYEQQMFLNSMCNIFEYISKEHTLFLVLNKLHFSEQSTLVLLHKILKRRMENISILANYNEAYAVPVYARDYWIKLINEAEIQNVLLDWNIQSTQQDNATDNSTFETTKRSLERHLVEINNMVMTTAFDQALYYLDIIYHKIITEKNISQKNLVEFYELYIYASAQNEQTTTALMMCERLKTVIQDGSPYEHFEYYYLLCMVQAYAGQYPLAEKNILKLHKWAERTNSQDCMFNAKLIELIVEMKGFKSILRWDCCLKEEEYIDFLKEAEKRGYYNHLAYIYIFGYCNERKYYSDQKDEYEEPVAFLKGIEFAKKLNNNHLLFVAWQKNVLMAQGYGYYSSVDYYYKKCLEIVENDNNPSQEAAIYNGLGYNRIVSEQTQQADEYFNKALKIYMQCKDNYYIAETLYNKATNAILAEEYEDAYDLLLLVLKILKAIKMNRMRICNLSKIYGFLVLCSYRMGISYNANFYLNQMERMLRHILKPDGEPNYFLWDDDMFLYYFTSGLVAKADDIELAQYYFDRARFHMNRSDGFLFLSYPQFAVEQAELYKLQNRNEEAKKVLEDCIDYCSKYGYKKKEETLFAHLYQKKVIHKRIYLGISIETRHQIENLYRIQSMEIELADKNKGLKFLVTWQEALNRDNVQMETFIENAMSIIQNNYNVDRILYVDIQDGVPEVLYKTPDLDIDDESIQNLNRYFSVHHKEFVVSRFERSFFDNAKLISLFGLNKVLSMACVPMVSNDKLCGYMIGLSSLHDNMTGDIKFLSTDDLTIFKFALKQLSDALYRLRTRIKINDMNRKLQKSAVTDFLTGLLNRNGFNKKVMDHEREKQQKNLPDIPFVVLYMDLDNFKYCNDTFGHDVGDIILKEFSKLFEEVSGESGYCVRYGGDEFIIVLPGKTKEDGVETAKRIYQIIEERNHFIPSMEKYMHTTIDVPDESKVSCSIGIADGEVYDIAHMTLTLKHADTILYSIKKTSKRNYKVYEE
ncbi:MAG: diguanylate cyclase [Acutalibacteraceae bacterium]